MVQGGQRLQAPGPMRDAIKGLNLADPQTQRLEDLLSKLPRGSGIEVQEAMVFGFAEAYREYLEAHKDEKHPERGAFNEAIGEASVQFISKGLADVRPMEGYPAVPVTRWMREQLDELSRQCTDDTMREKMRCAYAEAYLDFKAHNAHRSAWGQAKGAWKNADKAARAVISGDMDGYIGHGGKLRNPNRYSVLGACVQAVRNVLSGGSYTHAPRGPQ